MNSIIKRLLGIAIAVVICCSALGSAMAGEEEISLKEVPEAVKAAARKAVKGIKLTEAERVTKGSKVVYYEIEGTKGGKEYEIIVSPAGKVLKVEIEDDDDDDDEDDDKKTCPPKKTCPRTRRANRTTTQ